MTGPQVPWSRASPGRKLVTVLMIVAGLFAFGVLAYLAFIVFLALRIGAGMQ